MNNTLAGKNIVFVGRFEPAKFDKFFFIKASILKEEEISETSVFRPEMVHVHTSDITILILPHQIIITQLKIEGDRVKEVSSLFVSASSLEVSAMGINFTWHVFPTGRFETYTKNYFFNEKNKMFLYFFDTEDSAYGSYVSKDFMNGRLKLDIKPQTIAVATQNAPAMIGLVFAFNFHFVITGKEQLITTITTYKDLLSESEKIISNYE